MQSTNDKTGNFFMRLTVTPKPPVNAKKAKCYRRTDRQADRQTDRAGCRVACTRLKII